MKKIIYSLVISLVLTAGITSLCGGFEEEMQNGITRLHIVADSDSRRAQSVKLKVRDAVLENVDLSEENFLEKAEQTARGVLKAEGENYGAKAYYGKFYFPSKQYKNITLPAGEYYGVRLVLGSGSGQNWWCVMYPPMCAVGGDEAKLEKSSEKLLRSSVSPESCELITDNGDKVKIKFKTVEIAQNIKHWLSEK
ncbi:MAG TPA: stage II sporulation protein R [Candidatus Ornithomonoglobus intestinigallinarum]|uniref:Stage II sporulation protein R n=1 Tax=Candidatus Ornithomonoglobus intestinigallinarum TaxID=2840894 RepID=A0A9D1KPM9_9FIRM|nr:stage II sporulation protein R [Candidatus Ornithomonoglobus intestinigallinarum]